MTITRGTIRPTTRAAAVQRGLAQLTIVGLPPNAPAGSLPCAIHYCEEPGHNGGANPLGPHCASPAFGARVWAADCVGLVLDALGIDRLQPGYVGISGEWLHCPSMIDDAEHGQRWFEPVDYKLAESGDVLITRDHTGLIVRPARGEGDHLVVDCSPRHGRKTGVGTGGPWSEACRVIRYRHFAPPGPF